jgi:SAM-dependent methyltransferase
MTGSLVWSPLQKLKLLRLFRSKDGTPTFRQGRCRAFLEGLLAGHAPTDWEKKAEVLRAVEILLQGMARELSRGNHPFFQALASLRAGLAGTYLELWEEKNPDRKIKSVVSSIAGKPLRALIKEEWSRRRAEWTRHGYGEKIVGWEKTLTSDLEYGKGMEERVVEVPLVLECPALWRPGKILDAGASLNRDYIKAVLAESPAQVVHLTQSMDREAPLFEGSRYSFLFGDLRRLDFKDNVFDAVCCISTLEHVGCDNQRYGGPLEMDAESYKDAFEEMWRVLSPGGELILTVPYGTPSMEGWFRVFGPEEVEGLGRGRGECLRKYFYYDGFWFEGGADVRFPSNPAVQEGERVIGMAALRFRKPG